MRLIDTSTLKLSEFIGDHIPPYAILSHRWEGSEVTYQELSNGTWSELAGASKIRGCCAQAQKDGFQWAWIDSCCIDKSSSAELSEAINSMFKWYQHAEVCYAYLSDVTSAVEDPLACDSDFRRSQWFTRGWTLQELLAPQFVEFYDLKWIEIGSKSSLARAITEITGIAALYNYQWASVAQKLSWAARRKTTREEDIAYCLMGLFDINMPTLYGEGHKAFLRLQLEILNKSDDESIFAWEVPDPPVLDRETQYGLLAHSLTWFRLPDVVVSPFDKERKRHSITNKGLCIELLVKAEGRPGEQIFFAPLNCAKPVRKQGHQRGSYVNVSLWIVRVWDEYIPITYRRHTLIYENMGSVVKGGFTTMVMFFEIYKPIREYSISSLDCGPIKLVIKSRILSRLGFRPEAEDRED